MAPSIMGQRRSVTQSGSWSATTNQTAPLAEKNVLNEDGDNISQVSAEHHRTSQREMWIGMQKSQSRWGGKSAAFIAEREHRIGLLWLVKEVLVEYS